jgi:hypothetical protein
VLLKVINKPHKQSISMATTVCNVYVTPQIRIPLSHYTAIHSEWPNCLKSRFPLQMWLTHDLMVLQLPPLGGSTVVIDVGDDNGLEGGAMIAVEAQVEEASE